MEPYAEVQIIRIVQEALANVRKHADASEVTIRATADQELLTIDVMDNGKGISLPEPGAARFGVAIMRERSESAGGTMEIGPGPNGGTRVHVEVPFTLRPTTSR